MSYFYVVNCICNLAYLCFFIEQAVEKQQQTINPPAKQHPPKLKGAGPKIKTKDGSKVHLKDLMKSREGERARKEHCLHDIYKEYLREKSAYLISVCGGLHIAFADEIVLEMYEHINNP